jgi:phage RecT family recombinase
MDMNETASPPPHPMVVFKRDMDAMVLRELGMLTDKDKERMKSAAIVAVTKDPDLLLADRQSFMGAIRMCAQHGVTPDGNEATLQVYNTKVKKPNGQEEWVKKVTYLPMIRGIVNRIMRSGKIKLFYAEVVYENETFRIDQTHGDRRPTHDFDPMRRGADKDIVGAYSVAVYDDGTTDCEPMPRAEIEKVKASAKTKNVWDGWYSEKAKVAVMKRHSKRLPLSAEDMDFILNRDETDFDQSPRDVTPEEKLVRPNLAQRLAAPPQEAEIVLPHWTDSVAWDEAFPGSTAWDEGVTAFRAEKVVQDCPYEADETKATDWIGGWHGAKEAAS